MSREERSGWRDQAISEQHRLWGDMFMADLDLVVIEYYFATPAALVEYKNWRHHEGPDVNVRHQTYTAIGKLCGEDGKQLPFYIARYWPDTWAIAMTPVNEAACEFLERTKRGRAEIGDWIALSNRQWVQFLHYLRGVSFNESLMKVELRDELPPTQIRAVS